MEDNRIIPRAKNKSKFNINFGLLDSQEESPFSLKAAISNPDAIGQEIGASIDSGLGNTDVLSALQKQREDLAKMQADNMLRAEILKKSRILNDVPINNLSIPQGQVDDGSQGMFNPITGIKGTKATRNNNPGNITGMGNKLLYGAIGFAKSRTGDNGDQNQLVYKTPQEGFRAMHELAVKRYSQAPINMAFSKWQTDQKSFANKISDLNKYGIDTRKRYVDLTPDDQKLFRKIWSQHEGYRGTYY